MAGLRESDNKPPGSLKAISTRLKKTRKNLNQGMEYWFRIRVIRSGDSSYNFDNDDDDNDATDDEDDSFHGSSGDSGNEFHDVESDNLMTKTHHLLLRTIIFKNMFDRTNYSRDYLSIFRYIIIDLLLSPPSY
ncbi:hypothetical protein ANN_05208 [Periplaneta americana]|uniref:Uncharacterized protein n=1 Tax=Periplaneta americana TaxID=6978 RepID=A0ABQ8TC57_PERAM|nr:hypothetical protein ANN_05208 [Periplaneta americana]